MKTTAVPAAVKAAILTLADIKAVTEAFDRGEQNAFDALEAIAVALEALAAATRRRQDAA